MSHTAQEIRELVEELRVVAMRSPCMSVALPIVTNACDHLSAIARIHELNSPQPLPHLPKMMRASLEGDHLVKTE